VIVIDVEQGTREWFLAKRGIPSASELKRVITSAGKLSASADDYIGQLVDEIVHPDAQAQAFSNAHTERGHALEPRGRDWYRFVHGVEPRKVGFVLNDEGTAGCSPDSLIGGDGGLEIKAPEGKKHVVWMLANELPDEHKQQVHGSLAITGLKFWDFLSYCPGYKPFLIRVLPDNYTARIAETLDQFCARLADAKRQFIDYIPRAA